MPDGTAWVDDGEGGELCYQMVVGNGGALGVRRIREELDPGLDQEPEERPLNLQSILRSLDQG